MNDEEIFEEVSKYLRDHTEAYGQAESDQYIIIDGWLNIKQLKDVAEIVMKRF